MVSTMSKGYPGKRTFSGKEIPLSSKTVHDRYRPWSSSVGVGSSNVSSTGICFTDILNNTDADVGTQDSDMLTSNSFGRSFLLESEITHPFFPKMSPFTPDSAGCSSSQSKDLSSKRMLSSKAMLMSSSSSSLESLSLPFAELSSSMETLAVSSDSQDVSKSLIPEIHEANLESRKTRSVLPLLKLELKSKIQLKRLKAGKEELKVDFTPSKHKMSFEELKNRERKREQNRMSALKSRHKQRNSEEQIQKRYQQMDSARTKLLEERATLRFEKNMLILKILTHLENECQADSRDEDLKRLTNFTVTPITQMKF